MVPPLSALPDTAVRPLSGKYVSVGWTDLPGWASDDLKNGWSIFIRNCRGLVRPTSGNLAGPARAAPPPRGGPLFSLGGTAGTGAAGARNAASGPRPAGVDRLSRADRRAAGAAIHAVARPDRRSRDGGPLRDDGGQGDRRGDLLLLPPPPPSSCKERRRRRRRGRRRRGGLLPSLLLLLLPPPPAAAAAAPVPRSPPLEPRREHARGGEGSRRRRRRRRRNGLPERQRGRALAAVVAAAAPAAAAAAAGASSSVSEALGGRSVCCRARRVESAGEGSNRRRQKRGRSIKGIRSSRRRVAVAAAAAAAILAAFAAAFAGFFLRSSRSGDGFDGGLDGRGRLRQGPRGRRRGEFEGVCARGRPGAGSEGLGDAGAQRAERGLRCEEFFFCLRGGIRVSFFFLSSSKDDD